MSTYLYGINNIVNIATNISNLTTRINTSFELTTTLNSITFDTTANNLVISFVSALNSNELKVLEELINLNVELYTVSDYFQSPRIITSNRFPTVTNDDLNTNSIGDIMVNYNTQTIYY